MKIGFLLKDIGDSELAKTFVEKTNQFLCDKDDTDIIAFVNNQSVPVVFPIFSTMNINEAFDYDGNIIATDMATAAKLAKFPGPKLRYYYLWKPEWMANEWSFEENLRLFNDPRLSIITRTESDKKLVEQCWNCRVEAVIPDCDIQAFAEKIRQDEN